jgi:hypothetical protein
MPRFSISKAVTAPVVWGRCVVKICLVRMRGAVNSLIASRYYSVLPSASNQSLYPSGSPPLRGQYRLK